MTTLAFMLFRSIPLAGKPLISNSSLLVLYLFGNSINKLQSARRLFVWKNRGEVRYFTSWAS